MRFGVLDLLNDDKDAILLAAGHFRMEMGNVLHVIHDALRDEVILAALNGEHADSVRKAVRQRRRITFREEQLNLVVRWTPCRRS